MERLKHRHRSAHQEAERLVEEIKQNPHQVGHLLMHGRWAGARAKALGTNERYRLLWSVSESPKRIVFRTVGPRKSVYEQPKPREAGESDEGQS